LSGEDPPKFGLIHPAAAYQGQDILILFSGKWSGQVDAKLRTPFDRVESPSRFVVSHAGQPALKLPVGSAPDAAFWRQHGWSKIGRSVTWIS
jgi:hypothetical protein